MDFAGLQQQYPDIKAWLTIPGTVVDYPVLQSSAEDPEHYLRRNYGQEWRMAGSLFFQSDCTPQSRNLVIYGHNMNDGSMFGVLEEMMDAGFLQEHAALTLETPEGARNFKIVTAIKTDINQTPFTRVEFSGDEDFLSFADQLL
ncbi:class B sortase [Candidatus Allofournierella merdipullorum]|uniref:class B sortase n=1 Tax=Candidatus Allofournierella merdipullorum TaxID=2838595 RepID=UPI002A89AA97|nr:class B sortase [Candidatus Fournierella merdipullorum]